jgi:two-component system chemotaxis response regulator CheY
MRKILQRALRQAGFAVTAVFEAGSGLEALEVVRQQELDLILSDINMPAMDGLQFLQQLQALEHGREVPVLMITSEANESHVRQALSSGARGYLRKPFTPDQIRQRLLPLVANDSFQS